MNSAALWEFIHKYFLMWGDYPDDEEIAIEAANKRETESVSVSHWGLI